MFKDESDCIVCWLFGAIKPETLQRWGIGINGVITLAVIIWVAIMTSCEKQTLREEMLQNEEFWADVLE